jgi:hypothetical protein
VALTGSTGEDYTISLVNAIVLETADPGEIEDYVLYLRDHPTRATASVGRPAHRAVLYLEAAVRNLLGKPETRPACRGSWMKCRTALAIISPQRCNKISLRLSRADLRRGEWNAHQACPRAKKQTWLISE